MRRRRWRISSSSRRTAITTARHFTALFPASWSRAAIKQQHKRGTVATARTGGPSNPEKRSSGSQFFINVKDNSFLNGDYTVFGNVIAGMDVADKIVAVPRDGNDNPNEKVDMKVSITTWAEALKK